MSTNFHTKQYSTDQSGFAIPTNYDKVRVVIFQTVQLSRFHLFSIESYSLSKLNGKSKNKNKIDQKRINMKLQ